MRFRPFALSTILLAGFATPVLAQNQALAGLGQAMGLIGGIFQGAFAGIATTPNVWFRVILGIILLVILTSSLPKSFPKNARIVLAITISIAAVSAIPRDVINALFNSLGAIWNIILFVPLLIVLWKSVVGPHSRGRSWFLAFIWALMFVFYSSMAGNNLSATFSSTAGLLSAIALIGTIIWVIKALRGPTPQQFENDIDKVFRKEEKDLGAANDKADDAQKATEEAKKDAEVEKAQIQDSERKVAELAQRIDQLTAGIKQNDDFTKAAIADYEIKLKAAQDAQKNAESAAEQLRKAQEAEAARQKAEAARQEDAQKQQAVEQELKARLDDVLRALTDLERYSKGSVGRLLGVIKRIKDLEAQVKRALEEVQTLQREASGLASIHTYDKRVGALNDATLSAKFADLQKNLKNFNAQVDGLNGIKVRLEKHLQYYTQSRQTLEQLAKRIQRRGDILARYIKMFSSALVRRQNEVLPVAMQRLADATAMQKTWAAEMKKELEGAQQYLDYQGKAANVIKTDIATAFSEVNRLYKQLLPALKQSIAVFETELATAETQKAEAQKLAGK